MSDDSPDGRDDPRTTSFEEWLDQHAESQGISRQELCEQLISSYWTLNEMVQLLDDSGNDTSLSDLYPDDGDATGAVPTIGAGGSDADRDTERSRGRDRGGPDRRRGQRDRVDRDRIAELRDRLEDVESRLDTEEERGQSQDGMIEALADRLSGMEADLEGLSSESEAAHQSLWAEYESLSDRIDELESALSAERQTRAEQHETLADEQQRLDANQESLAEGQERIRAWLDSEFDSLQTILEHLVSRDDDLDARLSQSESRYEERLSELRADREALRSLKREAAAHDAHEGTCGNCGETIDLDLLAAPSCPDCDASLSGIEERSKWLFLSDITVTTKESAEAGRRSDGPPADSPPSRNPAAETGRDKRSDPQSGQRRERAAPSERERGTAAAPPGTDRTDGIDGADTPSFGGDSREANDGGASFEFGDIEETEADPPSDTSTDEGSGPRTRMQIGKPAEEADDEDGVAGNDGASDPPDAPFGDLDDLRRGEAGDGDE
jgi:peptidoglycan hydrolase CwlO-like protein